MVQTGFQSKAGISKGSLVVEVSFRQQGRLCPIKNQKSTLRIASTPYETPVATIPFYFIIQLGVQKLRLDDYQAKRKYPNAVSSPPKVMYLGNLWLAVTISFQVSSLNFQKLCSGFTYSSFIKFSCSDFTSKVTWFLRVFDLKESTINLATVNLLTCPPPVLSPCASIQLVGGYLVRSHYPLSPPGLTIAQFSPDFLRQFSAFALYSQTFVNTSKRKEKGCEILVMRAEEHRTNLFTFTLLDKSIIYLTISYQILSVYPPLKFCPRALIVQVTLPLKAFYKALFPQGARKSGISITDSNSLSLSPNIFWISDRDLTTSLVGIFSQRRRQATLSPILPVAPKSITRSLPSMKLVWMYCNE